MLLGGRNPGEESEVEWRGIRGSCGCQRAAAALNHSSVVIPTDKPVQGRGDCPATLFLTLCSMPYQTTWCSKYAVFFKKTFLYAF